MGQGVRAHPQPSVNECSQGEGSELWWDPSSGGSAAGHTARLGRGCVGKVARTGGALCKNGQGEKEMVHPLMVSEENFQIKSKIPQYCLKKRSIAFRHRSRKGWEKAPLKGAFQ